METTLTYLTYLGVVLLVGLLMSILAKKLNMPNVLLLLLSGIGLANIKYNGELLMNFNPAFLMGISMLALVMIVFDGSSKFKWREFDTLSFKALNLIIIFLLLNMIILSTASYFIMGFASIPLALIFAVIMSGTDPATVLCLFKSKLNRAVEILKVESVLNTPLIVLIPFIILDVMTIESGAFTTFLGQVVPFIQQIITGVGAGVVLGVIVFKLMRKFYSEELSPLAVMVTALLAFVLAENLAGNGVLAVTTLGLMFGNMYVKEKTTLKEFSKIFSNALEILVFVLVGFMVHLTYSVPFFLKAFAIFIILIGIRYLAIQITFRHDNKFTVKNKLFMAMNVSKGISVAVLALSFSLKNIRGMAPVLDLILVLMIFSIVLSTVVGKLAKYMIIISEEKKTCPVKEEK